MVSISIFDYWNSSLRLFSEMVFPGGEAAGEQFLSLADKARKTNSLNILLADDDIDDRDIFKDAMAEVVSGTNLQFAVNGKKLLDMITTSDQWPDLIFLDLNMPLKNGFECLEQIRKNKKMNLLPIVIYTTTANPDQVKNTFNRGANLFWQKPSDYDSIKKMLNKIMHMPFETYLPKGKKDHFMLKL